MVNKKNLKGKFILWKHKIMINYAVLTNVLTNVFPCYELVFESIL